MSNKVAPNEHCGPDVDRDVEQAIEKEVSECMQRVMDKLTAIGPYDTDVNYQIEVCMQHIDKLRSLEKEDIKAYEAAIVELQMISIGKRQDPSAPVSPAMAETVLSELDEITPISYSRKDVEAVLTDSTDDKYMGDPGIFVSIEDGKGDPEDAKLVNELRRRGEL